MMLGANVMILLGVAAMLLAMLPAYAFMGLWVLVVTMVSPSSAIDTIQMIPAVMG